MPYKDKEKQRAYQREYKLNKGSKSAEEIYGKEKAAAIQKAMSASWTSERRAKQAKIITERNRKMQWTLELRQKISEAFKGKLHSKPSPLKGKTHNEFYGVKKASEIREKRRIGQLNSYPPERREKIAKLNKQRQWTEESRRKSSEWHKLNNTLPSRKGTHISEETRLKLIEIRKHLVIPTKDTSIEVKIQTELTKRGIKFHMHYPIKGQPDIAFPEQKIAVFADGNYWHSLEKSKIRDVIVNNFLRKEGWNVMRYSETEINANSERIVDEIQVALLGKEWS